MFKFLNCVTLTEDLVTGILLPITTDHCWLMFKGGHFPSILNNHDTLRNVLLLWAREGSPLEVIVIPISKSMH